MRVIASERRRTSVTATATSGAAAADRWTWLRHPEFWIALALGAVLRLWALDSTHFLFDQATLMTLARDAVLSHAVPVAGLASSIRTLNPPITVYLLLPFAVFGTNPLPAVVALALWNVLGVALCYIFALRYFGRRIAALGSLLFAAGPAAVMYSRFLWPQNYLPPLLTLFALALYAGCIRGWRGMLAPAVLALTLAALLHPAALLLTPALLAGVLLAPRRPRWGEYALSAAIVAVLLLPTLIWELVSGWSDLHMLVTFSSGQAKIDPEVFFRLYEALGAPGLPQSGSIPHAPPRSLAGVLQLLGAPVTSPSLGAASPFTALAPLYVAAGLAAMLLFAMGWLVLTARILAPALKVWRDTAVENSGKDRRARLRVWASAVWRGARANGRPADTSGRPTNAPARRAYLLLWLLVTSPLALLIRHSSPIFSHYLIALYPFAFLTMAFGVVFLAHAAARLAGRMRVNAPVARTLVLALVAALVLGQAAQSLLYTASIATGRFDAGVASYGYPLGALQQADARLSAFERQSGVKLVFIAEGLDESIAMDYTLVREHADRVGFVDECLVLPPPDAGPALVVASSGSLVERVLASLPNATLLAAMPMAGNSPLAVYRVSSTAPMALPGETPLAHVGFEDASGDGLQLEAGRIDGQQVLLRWSALGSTPPGAVPLVLRTSSRYVNAATQVSSLSGFRDCAPTRWQAGDTVIIGLPRSPSWASAPGGSPETLHLQEQRYTTTYAMPTFGPVHLLSSEQVSASWSRLAAQPPAGQSLGGMQLADGGVVLSESNL